MLVGFIALRWERIPVAFGARRADIGAADLLRGGAQDLRGLQSGTACPAPAYIYTALCTVVSLRVGHPICCHGVCACWASRAAAGLELLEQRELRTVVAEAGAMIRTAPADAGQHLDLENATWRTSWSAQQIVGIDVDDNWDRVLGICARASTRDCRFLRGR